MSAIAAVLGLHGRDATDAPTAVVQRMLAASRARGADTNDGWSSADAERTRVALGVCRHHWELAAIESRGIVQRADTVIAADATLYYRDDLRRQLAQHGTEVARCSSSAELILAAYEAWGDRCAERLEGDFAFIIWDGRARRLFAARDFAGRRTLFHARSGHRFWIASSVDAILADPTVPRDISLTTLTTVAAGLWQHSAETARRAISELPAGCSLVITAEGTMEISRHWRPADREVDNNESLADASRHLQELLVRAVDERMSVEGPTAVSLSGGWDSPAVFGAGQLVARHSSGRRSIRPVSISYPPGDPGREDEIIESIVGPWGATPEWIQVDDVPMFADPEGDAARRAEPFAHAYEEWNRELSRGARRVGARVILDGAGGDQLFQVSDIYLADLFSRGRWVELARQWRVGGGAGGVRPFYHAAVRRALPPWLSGAIAKARGSGRPPHYLERHPPFWFRRKFLDEHGVLERERAERPALPRSGHVIAETHAFLLFPFYPRIMRMLQGFGVEEGVELRSPLLDDRIVRFAVPRPWHERANGKETKLVLRGAMRGVLPDSVLAPRPKRTGITSAYFIRQLRGARPYFERMMEDSALASIGMIDLPRLRHAWEHFARHDDDELGGRLFFTLQAELWFRARS